MSETDPSGAGEAQLAAMSVKAAVSIVVPTFREAENIPILLRRIGALREAHGLTCEVILVDDDSRDGSVEAVERLGFDWARIVVRTKDRGLSSAVIDGFAQARFPVVVCMDADLSHPVEAIPAMMLALASGQQMVLGSRYVPGGSTDDDWGLLRWLNSHIATLLARPLTQVRDPMSGFFALRKSDFDAAADLNPVGYKIALELIVKCGFENVGEVPIAFADRIHGESKLTLRQQLLYLQHLRRLYLHKFAEPMHFLQFLTVGASGVLVNLAVLSLFELAGAASAAAIAAGIAVSVVTNFLLNRRFSFSYARQRSAARQFLGFLAASSVGLIVNYAVALHLVANVFGTDTPFSLQLAALGGIVSGMLFNFVGNRYIVFRKRYLR